MSTPIPESFLTEMKLNSTVKASLFLLLCNITIAQDMKVNKTNTTQTESSLESIKSVEKLSIIKNDETRHSDFIMELYDIQFKVNKPSAKKDVPRFDLISSFRSNIRFGGFWDKYSIINFTPEMSIKLYDFISIYAIHSMSYFVPIDRIKQNFRSMALRSAAIMVVDNSVKFLLGSSKLIGPILSFLAKNLLIYSINKIEEESDKKNNLNNYDYHFYSISIRF